jgi:hypothetical protein
MRSLTVFRVRVPNPRGATARSPFCRIIPLVRSNNITDAH